MNWGGLRAGHYRPLSQEDVERIHRAALEILADVGMAVHSTRCLEFFRAAGAQVEGKLVRISPEIVERALETAPSSVTLYGRGAGHNLHLEADRVYR